MCAYKMKGNLSAGLFYRLSSKGHNYGRITMQLTYKQAKQHTLALNQAGKNHLVCQRTLSSLFVYQYVTCTCDLWNVSLKNTCLK